MDQVRLFNSKQNLKQLPEIRPGFTVRVHQKIKEGEKSRIQVFEGLVIAKKHGSGPSGTITVRRIAGGYGVERTFPLHSPNIERFEVIKISKVRRAKLYYIREKAAKEIKKKMKASQFEEKLKKIKEKQEEAQRIKEEKAKTAAAETPPPAEVSENKQKEVEGPEKGPAEKDSSKSEKSDSSSNKKRSNDSQK